MTINAFLASPAARFLVCGGSAAAINWLARIALSERLSFEIAVIIAYVIGMIVGFVLYRTFVWPDHATGLRQQLIGFVIVNAASAIVVFIASVSVRELLKEAALAPYFADAIAHGTGIAIGAVANFIGHRSITFKSTHGKSTHGTWSG